MSAQKPKEQNLLAENEELRQRLQEAEETLRAIQRGEVDAVVVSTSQGPQIYSLAGAETIYRLIIEEMSEGAVMLSNDNIILYCNKGFANIVKLQLERLIGTNIKQHIAPTHQNNFKAILTIARTSDRSASKEITFETSKKTIVPAFVSVNSIRTNGESTTFMVVTDLTKHMEQELQTYTKNLEKTVEERTKQLQEKERLAAIGQTAGMVGHDIRNPLQSIISELYLAKEELKNMPDTEAKENMKDSIMNIEEQVFYINKIVADLQDFTKPLTPNRQPINIQESIQEALSSLVIPENITVKIQAQENTPTIQTDRFFLKRILVNLISNALQAMPQGGTVKITTDYKNKCATIAVHDTESGIPENLKPQIFKPLFTTKAKGQGLGLAVVKRLAEAAGGSVHFESQVGKGTAFIVNLPLSPQ